MRALAVPSGSLGPPCDALGSFGARASKRGAGKDGRR